MADRPVGWRADSLSDFLERATANQWAAFQELSDDYRRLSEIDQLFLHLAQNLNNPPSWIAPMFLMRAHSAYRAAVRLGLSGQVTETYMVLRGCLEFALYGLHFSLTPNDYDIWLARHEGLEERKAVRQRFQIATLLGSLRSNGPKEADAVSYAYDMLIDLGAHPNMLSVYNSLRIESSENEIYIETSYLTGKAETIRPLMSVCAEMGIIGLGVFGFAFPERFAILGLWDSLQPLKRKP
jgi:hypothetical protein